MEKQRFGDFAKRALVMGLVMVFGLGGTVLLNIALKLGIPEWMYGGFWGGLGGVVAISMFPLRTGTPRKSIKEVGIWRAFSWPGILAFAIGPFATLYLLKDIFLVEFTYPPYEIQLLWFCLFLLLNIRKQRQLGIYSEWFEGEPKTRWQRWKAFTSRGSVWPDSIQLLPVFLPVFAALAGARYAVGRFELDVPPIVIAGLPLFALAILVIFIRGIIEIRKMRAWRTISWLGVLVFGAGYGATRYVLHHLLAVERSDFLDVLAALWVYPFVLMTFRKRRRLGLYPPANAKPHDGKPETRWQAFRQRARAWPDSIQALLGVLLALAYVLGSHYAVDRLWPGAEALKIAALLPLFALPAVLWWKNRRPS